jgi:hypothetical protein
LYLHMNLHMDEAFLPHLFHMSTPLANMKSRLSPSLLPFPHGKFGFLIFPPFILWDQLISSHFPPSNLQGIYQISFPHQWGFQHASATFLTPIVSFFSTTSE